jgi:hypothetical protein
MFKLIFHFFLVVLEIVTPTRQPYNQVEGRL